MPSPEAATTPAAPYLPLPDEPEGLVCTRSAGSSRLWALLAYAPGTRPPAGDLLNALRGTGGGAGWRLGLRVRPEGGDELGVDGEALGMTERDLGEAARAFLGGVGVFAARTGAVMKSSALRVADPAVPPPGLAERLATALLRGGVGVRFGRSWAPVPAGLCGVGCPGGEVRVERALLSLGEGSRA